MDALQRGKKKGVEFCCDICKSPSIANPSHRGNSLKQSGYRTSPRWKSDPETGKMLMLCNTCGGSRSNCYKFISWVTGCSHSTISRVNEQMRRTGGEREPTPHGLKKCWKVQLQIQQQQIEALKKQVQVLQRQQLQLQWEVTKAQPQHLQVFGIPDTLLPQPLSVHQPSSVITHRQPVGLQAKAMQQQGHISEKGLAIAQILLKPGLPQMVSAMQSIGVLQDGLQKNDVQNCR
ncbi:uncharacterized protein LOC125465559 isoform X2 [Stegostoma tigrinum]|uniref:uncharacterized protein LOC125465559 isoform X2 n=1 Tax=Stegostoma tigrinum TaxID=3053191 RepID=UPI00202B4D6A|nr:uncharacterized protein LOC125465559 isoform X2 [Stegostoma tigrinum]